MQSLYNSKWDYIEIDDEKNIQPLYIAYMYVARALFTNLHLGTFGGGGTADSLRADVIQNEDIILVFKKKSSAFRFSLSFEPLPPTNLI